MKLEISNTARTAFLRCRRLYQLRYIERITPVAEAEALTFGRAWHAAMELWWDPAFLFGEGRLEHARAILRHRVADQYQLATLDALLAGYAQHGPKPGDWDVLEVERPFALRVASMRGVIYRGVIDVLGRTRIIEHKTSGESIEPTARYWDRLAMDSQLSGYVLAARAMGYPVEAVVYDVVRKPTIRPGKIPLTDDAGAKIVLDEAGQRARTKDGKKWRETADAAQGHVLQTRPETAEEWGRRLAQDIEERPETYYATREVYRIDSQLEEFAEDLRDTVQEIRAAKSANRWPRNPLACSMPPCPFYEVCCGRASLEDRSLFRRSDEQLFTPPPDEAG